MLSDQVTSLLTTLSQRTGAVGQEAFRQILDKDPVPADRSEDVQESLDNLSAAVRANSVTRLDPQFDINELVDNAVAELQLKDVLENDSDELATVVEALTDDFYVEEDNVFSGLSTPYDDMSSGDPKNAEVAYLVFSYASDDTPEQLTINLTEDKGGYTVLKPIQIPLTEETPLAKQLARYLDDTALS